MNPGTGRVQRPRSRVLARACSGMCVAGFGRARAVMKMRSGKVVPLCSINQGGKENGCERQSLETAPREAVRGNWEGGESSAENRREAGPGALPPCASSRTSSAPQTLVRSLLKPPSSSPGSQHPFPNLNVPRLSSLCLNSEGLCTQSLQEHVSAHAHMPVAHVIAHLLPARTTAGTCGDALRAPK